jgi:hypothetical protein
VRKGRSGGLLGRRSGKCKDSRAGKKVQFAAVRVRFPAIHYDMMSHLSIPRSNAELKGAGQDKERCKAGIARGIARDKCAKSRGHSQECVNAQAKQQQALTRLTGTASSFH